MRIVSYADEHFRTTDAVADAVLQYSMLLARGESSDVIRIPVMVDTQETWAQLIVGPASQITTLEVPDSDEDSLDDVATVADLLRRVKEVERARSPMEAVAADARPAAVLPDYEH